MSQTVSTSHTRHRVLYVTSALILVVMVVIGLFTFHSATSSARAQDKADQLTAALQSAGLRTPSKDMIVRVLGDDGGAVCANPGSSLTKAVLFDQLTNGAAGPGRRPVIVDGNVLRGELVILQVYCPEQVPDFSKVQESLVFDDVVKG
jgi:hypothetical protein